MEQVLYIIGQFLGGVCVVLGFVNYQVKTREQVLIVNALTALCFAFHFMLLGAWTGMALNFVGFIRSIVFYFVSKNGKVGKVWSIAFALILAAMGIVGWENWYSIFMIMGLTINSYCMSFSNPNDIRKSILITSPMVIVYNAFVFSVGGIVYESIVIISSVIGLWRFKKAKDNQ